MPQVLLALAGSRYLLYALGILGLAISYEGWKYHQQYIGAERVTAKIEKVTDNAAKLGGSAAAGSRDKRVRGQRDPTTRDD